MRLLLTYASTIQRSIKRELPLIITYSFHVKLTLKYYFSSEKENEALKLKICHYLGCESDLHLGVLRKANANTEKRTQFWTLRGVVTCYNCANPNAKRRCRDGCLY